MGAHTLPPVLSIGSSSSSSSLLIGRRHQGANDDDDKHQPGAMEIVEVTVLAPAPSVIGVPLQIAPNDLFIDLRTALLDCTALCSFTSFQFEFEGKLCPDYEQIGPDRRQFKMVEIPYTFASIREHVHRLQHVLRYPPKTLLMKSWAQNLSNSINCPQVDTAHPFETVPICTTVTMECESFDKPMTANSLVTISKSRYDPPRGSRRVQGDLVYLDIVILDRTTLSITGTQSGFHINKLKDNIAFDPSIKGRTGPRSSTLSALLCKSSQAFRSGLAGLLSSGSCHHPIIQAPISCSAGFPCYVEPELGPTPLRFDHVKTERNWNDEFLIWSEHVGEATTESTLTCLRNQYKTYSDFINSAIDGAVKAALGELPPLNINEPRHRHVYLFNSIFFSVANDSRGIYADHGGDLTAHKFASHDLHSSSIISKILPSDSPVHTLMSVVVDYSGFRISCQAIVPGVIAGGTSMLLFGSIEQSPEQPEIHQNKIDNANFTETTELLAERLHWKKIDVEDLKGNVIFGVSLPMDCKGVLASDGRTYLMDLVRITPRDVNFPDSLSSNVRFELSNRWCHDRALDIVMRKWLNDKQTAAAPSADQVEPKTSTHEAQDTRGKGYTSEVIAAAASIKFNVNASTQYRTINDDGDEVGQAISKSILDEAIPALITDMKSLSRTCIDSRSMASLFHSHGVNMRYLGIVHLRITDTLQKEQPALCSTLTAGLYREILVRSCKHLLSADLRAIGASGAQAATITTFLNNVLLPHLKSRSKSALWSRIAADMKSRFSFSPSRYIDSMPSPLSVLTGICKAVGLQIRRRTYDFSESGAGVGVDDMIALRPVAKYHLPEGIDTTCLFTTARAKIENNEHAEALEILSQLIQILSSVSGPIDASVAEAFSKISSLSFQSGETMAAIDQSYRVIVIQERLYGDVDGELARAHSQHALFLMCGGFHKRSLHHAVKAKQICELLGGPCHIETAIAVLNVAVVLMDMVKPAEALEQQLDGVDRLESAIGPDVNHLYFGIAFHAVAYSYAALREFRQAVEYEKRSRSIAQALNDEALVTQCNAWLSLFTQGAVSAAKNEDEQITVKATAAVLSWITMPYLTRALFITSQKDIITVNSGNLEPVQVVSFSGNGEPVQATVVEPTDVVDDGSNESTNDDTAKDQSVNRDDSSKDAPINGDGLKNGVINDDASKGAPIDISAAEVPRESI